MANTTISTTTSKTTTVEIWAPIVAVAGILIIALLVFFAVRHIKMKRSVDTENQPGYEVPYAETQYEQPYRNSDKNESQNYTENLNNEEIYEPYEYGEYAEYKIHNKK